MRMVFQIAKAELRNLFYSPVAWFLAITFMIMMSWNFSVGLIQYAKVQDMMLANPTGQKDFWMLPMTAMLYVYGDSNIFNAVLHNLYLFIPLLAMGLVSREVNTGTIKLLFSSPVKLRQVVAGKYLAVVGFNLVLVGIVGLCFLATMFSIRSADIGLMLSAALGFFLLTCAYTAIGLFMSSLTNYQILSAIATFLVIFTLDRIGNLWQKIDIVRDIMYSIHLAGRTDRMLKGLIASKDLIYFLMIVFLFLCLTLFRLKAQREKKSWRVHLMRVTVLLLLVVSVSYISSRQTLTRYWDVTASNLNTISPVTQHVISDLGDAPVEIVVYTNLLHSNPITGFPECRNDVYTTIWEKYLRFKPDMKFRYVNYYYYEKKMDGGVLGSRFPGKNIDEMAVEVAKEYKVNIRDFVPVAQLEEKEFLKKEFYQLVMQVKFNNRTEVLRAYPYMGGNNTQVIGSVWPDERNIAAVFKRLTHPEKIPTISFPTGNLERDIHFIGESGYFNNTLDIARKDGLINQGFDIDTVDINNHQIPAHTDILVLADPKTELSDPVQRKIIDYIDAGGNCWILGEPGKQQLLNPILKHLGVEMLGGNLVEPTYNEMPQMVQPLLTIPAVQLSEDPILVRMRKSVLSSYKIDTPKMLMPGVAALSYSDSNDFVKKPLLLTSQSNSWLKKGKLVTDSAAIVYDASEGDIRGSFPTALQLSRKWKDREQRIIITGDADIFSNRRITQGDFMFSSMAHWLNHGEFPVYSPYTEPADNVIKITGDGAKKLLLLYVYVLPALLLITGTVLLIRRKRK